MWYITVVCSVAGLQRTVTDRLVHLSYQQPLLSMSTWQTCASLSLRCLSAVQPTFGNKTQLSLQLVCFIYVLSRILSGAGITSGSYACIKYEASFTCTLTCKNLSSSFFSKIVTRGISSPSSLGSIPWAGCSIFKLVYLNIYLTFWNSNVHISSFRSRLWADSSCRNPVESGGSANQHVKRMLIIMLMRTVYFMHLGCILV